MTAKSNGHARARSGNGHGNRLHAPAVRPFEPIAIIGMRGRFPGANDLDTYWHNLANGVESITSLSQEDMREAGIPDAVFRLPGYVNASPLLDQVDEFDAEFFGFSARDAALTDPQHRLFLETCWEALEDAGYDPAQFPGPIGLFGGCELSTYLYQLYQNPDSLQYIDGMQLMVTNDKDHLCTQASYRLNLRGPSVVVQTTCSTSLTAVSLACESLQVGRCDMAMAGGVTVRVPQRGGYFYTAGSILSPDGHCRPFDSNSQGTIVGSGVGLVVLRRLNDALAEGDNVRAVILGTGFNNDGNDKVGYTAPSFRGQAAAIRAAHAMSGVSADSVGYVEAHGTGTILGDPIEVAALNEVFKSSTDRRGYCGIGSVKSNFGHLSCAAGVAGLIKTVLALEHGAIPPTLHYSSPNPAIDFANSPFYVTADLQPWSRNGAPRHAGVSSFGVGGTNVHVVLEEAPLRENTAASRHRHQLLVLSARTAAALDTTTQQLARHLRAHPELPLADVAFTLQSGRRPFAVRRALVCDDSDRAGLIAALSDPSRLNSTLAAAEPSVVFLFPGQGTQYPGMAQSLYRSEPVVRRAIDHCAKVLIPELGADVRKILFAPTKQRGQAQSELRDTRWAQPALFTVGYALAQLWQSWGVKPAALIGHSVGEYVAATLSGVLALDDALKLIALRGRLVSSLPRGSMLAVMTTEPVLASYIGHNVALAAINSPNHLVLAGPDEDIAHLETALGGASILTRRLHTSHAFHSSMMEPILREFEDAVAAVPLSAPKLPFVATLTGEWADLSVATPQYWSAQLRSTVRFADAVRTLATGRKEAPAPHALIEVGPGNTLITFAGGTLNGGGAPLPCVTSLPGPHEQRSDAEVLLNSIGRLWAAGCSVKWRELHRTEKRSRVSLPTYPFERRSYWIGARPGFKAEPARHEARDPANWFHQPVWRGIPAASSSGRQLAHRRVLILDEGTGLGQAVAAQLRNWDGHPVLLRQGREFERLGDDAICIDPANEEHFERAAAAVCASGSQLAGVINCWSAAPPGETSLNSAGVLTLLAPLRLAHALSNQATVRPLPLLLVARGAAKVSEADLMDPARALGLGIARVLPQEHPSLRVSHVDVDAHADVAALLLAEVAAGASEPVLALRDGARFAETFEPKLIREAAGPLQLPKNPVVLITGGLGHMGMHLSAALFSRVNARLVLVGRTQVPDPTEWRAKSEDASEPEAMRALLKELARLREQRDDVLVLCADLNDAAQVRGAVDATMARFGRVDMVVHGAARIDAAAFASAAETRLEVMEAQFSPKLRGLLHVMEAFRGREPQRWVLHSSISAVLGGLGLAAYSAANAMLDAVAIAGGERWISIGWDLWDNAAEAKAAGMPVAIHPPEGAEAFLRLLGVDMGPRPLVVVSDFAARLKAWVRRSESGTAKSATIQRHPRPNLTTALVEPRTATERELADIWGAQLAVEPIGIHDRFFDLGGHSLLAVQVASEIRDRFQIDMPVLKLFQAPTVLELAVLIDKAKAGDPGTRPSLPPSPTETFAPITTRLEGTGPGVAAKESYREFYDDVSRRLEKTGVSEASFFLNYGYIPQGNNNEARFEVPEGAFNRSSIRLAFELIGPTDLHGRRVLDVGSGRGGMAALMAERCEAYVTGVDLAPQAVAFCRRTHRHPHVTFEVGDAEALSFDNSSFDVVTNVESSHTYPNLRAFYTQVSRVLRRDGIFLYTDLLPVQRWVEVRALLEPLGLRIQQDRPITSNVLASCDEVATTRAQAFGDGGAAIDNFLAVPGSMVYEQMRSGAWEYRIVRAVRI